MDAIENILIKIKKASTILANASTNVKNLALQKIADSLEKNASSIIEQNEIDLKNGVNANLSDPLLKRLKLDKKKLNIVIDGIHALIKIKDPVNNILSKMLLDDGLILTKISVPIGVIGVIFESRPDALIQIATLCLKSGNCAILKGGSEAINTNKILAQIIIDSILEVDPIFTNTFFLIETREDVSEILKYNKYINLIIPRGSNQFVQYIQKNSLIPVLGHADGICHIFIDKEVNMEQAIKIVIDSKTQYVAVCNALETLLVHKDIALKFLPELQKKIIDKNVVLKGDIATKKIIPNIEHATDEDWATEYLDLILSIKQVDNIDDAIDHINKYGSGHTDGIVTNPKNNAAKSRASGDSASVMVNCSTRFSDGYRYGMGAEVGVSTNKIHARGPVGLEGLVIYKFILDGDGHIVADYSDKKKQFKHKGLPLK